MYKGQNIGKVYDCVGGRATVISYLKKNSVVVEFECGTQVTSTITSLIRGKTGNPNSPSLLGVGFIGVGKFSSVDTVIYNVWCNMLKRCYDRNNRYYSCYGGDGVYVADSWHNFQNFADWYDSQDKEEGWQLDKDLLVLGNKVYSKEHCLLIPRGLNMLIQKRKVGVCQLPGVTKHGDRYRAQISTEKWEKGSEYLGIFVTPELAHKTYIDKKKEIVIEKAMEWEGRISDRVLQALLDYGRNLKYDWEK